MSVRRINVTAVTFREGSADDAERGSDVVCQDDCRATSRRARNLLARASFVHIGHGAGPWRVFHL